MQKKFIASALLLSALTLGGCATVSKEDLAEVRVLAEKAAADASEAKTMAADARSTADTARAEAEAANRKAAETETKIDRMFKKSMYK
ncbi:Lpp/OprI family alanine-zipper lipoprotein [Thiolapillus sp.]